MFRQWITSVFYGLALTTVCTNLWEETYPLHWARGDNLTERVKVEVCVRNETEVYSVKVHRILERDDKELSTSTTWWLAPGGDNPPGY